MRAVNLMPGDHGARRQAASSSMAAPVYVLLGGLAALVVFVSLWTVTDRGIASDTAKLAEVSAEAQAAEQRVQTSAPYKAFAELARNRVATVTSLSATRFDWAHGLREVARVVPGNVWLTTITGSSGVSEEAPGPTSSAAPAPRFEMKGCARSQADVARLMTRLRAVDGVRSVALKASEKPEASGGEECPANRSSDPLFTIVISFALPGQSKASVDATGQIGTSPAPAAADAAPAAPAGEQSPAKPEKAQDG